MHRLTFRHVSLEWMVRIGYVLQDFGALGLQSFGTLVEFSTYSFKMIGGAKSEGL
jgi:hypothetical protein